MSHVGLIIYTLSLSHALLLLDCSIRPSRIRTILAYSMAPQTIFPDEFRLLSPVGLALSGGLLVVFVSDYTALQSHQCDESQLNKDSLKPYSHISLSTFTVTNYPRSQHTSSPPSSTTSSSTLSSTSQAPSGPAQAPSPTPCTCATAQSPNGHVLNTPSTAPQSASPPAKSPSSQAKPHGPTSTASGRANTRIPGHT